MKVTGRIVGANIDFRTGKPTISFEVNEKNDFKLMVDEMRGLEKLSIEVKPFRARRSLDANAYAWVLMGKLASVLRKPKLEIYREYIREIGDNHEVVCIKNEAVDKFCRGWSHNGIGWVTDTFPSKIEGCTNVSLYYGSSTYDTAQMSRLIDLIIFDCKDNGIPTETPDEIARLKSMWGE